MFLYFFSTWNWSIFLIKNNGITVSKRYLLEEWSFHCNPLFSLIHSMMQQSLCISSTSRLLYHSMLQQVQYLKFNAPFWIVHLICIDTSTAIIIGHFWQLYLIQGQSDGALIWWLCILRSLHHHFYCYIVILFFLRVTAKIDLSITNAPNLDLILI